jgi:hypothetical protein
LVSITSYFLGSGLSMTSGTLISSLTFSISRTTSTFGVVVIAGIEGRTEAGAAAYAVLATTTV